MNAMLTDEELERLLGEAATSFAVPEHELEAPARPRRRLPDWWAKAAAGVAVIAIGTSFALAPHHSTTGLIGTAKSAPGAAESGGTTGGGGLAPEAPTDAVAGPITPDALRAPAVAGTGSGSSLSFTPDTGDGARIVKTATVTLAVDDGKVRPAVVALERLVVSARGYESDSSSDEVGDHPSAELTVRVPVAAYDAFLAQVRGLKLEVVSVTQTGKDVTATYADTQAQIQSLTAARGRFLAILARAKTIGETLTVQQRVDDVQQQIDRLEGQRRLLASQSDYATVTLSVAEKGAQDQAFVKKAPSGWSKAWHDATHGFTSGVQSIVAGSGRTLLVLLCGAALLLLGRTGWRLARRRLV